MFLQQPQTLTTGTGEKNCCQFVYVYIALHLSVCMRVHASACTASIFRER